MYITMCEYLGMQKKKKKKKKKKTVCHHQVAMEILSVRNTPIKVMTNERQSIFISFRRI